MLQNCYTKIKPDISFENDQNYLDGIDKISTWKTSINIFLDPSIKPMIKDKQELIIDLKGIIFRKLTIIDVESKRKYGCRVVFGKDIITSSNANFRMT